MTRSFGPTIALVLAALLVALLVYGIVKGGTNRSLDDAVSRGDYPTAPDRSLPLLGTGRDASIASYRGKVVVLNFWGSWCDTCVAETPVLEHAQQELARSGQGTVLGVTYNDTAEDSTSFLRKHGLTYPNLRDLGTKLAEDYGTRALPESFVIDKRGKIVEIFRGQLAQQPLDAAIAKAEKT